VNLTDFHPPVLSSDKEIAGAGLSAALTVMTAAAFSVRKGVRRRERACLSLIALLLVCAFPLLMAAQTRPPVLISEQTSTRAIAFESPTFFREPFSLTSPFAWSADRRTRVMLFALNLSLQPGENLSAVTADAEDAAHRHSSLQVEYVGPVPSQEWLSAVIVRLGDDLTGDGDVLVRVAYRGVGSNRVRVGLGHVGGGPADDAGAGPATVPPYLVSGRVTAGGTGLSGVQVALTGPQTLTATTDGGGFYSFTLMTAADDYTLAVSKPYYNFAPPGRTFHTLSSNQPNIDFTATRQVLTISGRATASGAGFGGVRVILTGPQTLTATTDGGGFYSFTVAAGEDYALAVSQPYYDFAPSSQTFSLLSSNQTDVNFNGIRQAFTVSGQVRDDNNQALDGIEVALLNEAGGAIRTALTSAGGNFSFPDLTAGYLYTVAPASTGLFTFPAQNTGALSGNLALNFRATRRLYSIHGRIMGTPGQWLGGVTVNLGGSQAAAASTDENGNYLFDGLRAGGDYTVAPSKAHYDFSPSNLTFQSLTNNQAADFQGTLRRHNINGFVRDEGGNGLAGIEVKLADATDEAAARTILSGADGSFSFNAMPEGGDYTVAATSTNYFTFTAQHIGSLAGDLLLSLNGVRPLYAISGRVTDGAGLGVGGVTVSLSGAQAATVSTDAGGNYSLAGLVSGGSYSVALARAYYNFTPQSRTFGNLGANQEANFSAALYLYNISGRVTDAGGNGIAGIAVSLGGAQAATTRTGSDGRYSFSAPATGDYTITPSIEQGFYLFAPSSRSLQYLIADQSVNFAATLALLPDPGYVIEFDGTPKTVDYGEFWEPYIDLGHFYWEFWAMPGTNASATYLLSDGYGGNHALLFGFAQFNASEAGRYQMSGNIWDGYVSDHRTTFGSDQGPAQGEWGHFAVGWDGQNMMTYFNGVPVGKTPFAGPRATPGYGNGGGKLLIGGSDHSNFDGRIAQIRGYEGSDPMADATGPTGGFVEASFAPQTIFGVGGNLLSYYFRSASKVADLSRGYNGSTHVGTPRGTVYGILSDCGACPPPRFVIDPTGPNFTQGIAPPPVQVATPPPAPGGARVFDSFSRANSTYLFNGLGGLGSTEAGTGGQQVWQTDRNPSGPQAFGILNGRAVLLGNETSVAWVLRAGHDGTLDARVNRHPGPWGSGLDTGLSFRVVDGRNYFFAYTSEGANPAAPRKLAVGYYLDGERFELATNVAMPSDWTTLRVLATTSGSIKVYAGATLVYSTTNKLLLSAEGAGLYNNSPGSGLVNRWDDFTVYDAP
jgi:hypothetical protein